MNARVYGGRERAGPRILPRNRILFIELCVAALVRVLAPIQHGDQLAGPLQVGGRGGGDQSGLPVFFRFAQNDA